MTRNVTEEDLTAVFRLSVTMSFAIAAAIGLTVYSLLALQLEATYLAFTMAVLTAVSSWLRPKHPRWKLGTGILVALVGVGGAALVSGGAVLPVAVFAIVGGVSGTANALLSRTASKREWAGYTEEMVSRLRALRIYQALSVLGWEPYLPNAIEELSKGQVIEGKITRGDEDKTRDLEFYIDLSRNRTVDRIVVKEKDLKKTTKWFREDIEFEKGELDHEIMMVDHLLERRDKLENFVFHLRHGTKLIFRILGELDQAVASPVEYAKSEKANDLWQRVRSLLGKIEPIKPLTVYKQRIYNGEKFYGARWLSLQSEWQNEKRNEKKLKPKTEQFAGHVEAEADLLSLCPEPFKYDTFDSDIKRLNTLIRGAMSLLE